jgi:RNA polymerase sigma-70 factor (ECF subfamily)
MSQSGGPSFGQAAEDAARNGYGRLVAFLAARTGDVAAAEDALADAFAAALADWPNSGVPRNPEAWLMAVARRRLIDAARRRRTSGEAAQRLQLLAEELRTAAAAAVIPDRRLALMFACAHPAIDPAIHAPLILQVILGFDAAMIGSAFLVSPTTMGQRLVRAKQKIRQAGIPFSVPERVDLPDRLDGVLAAIYAAFAAGWSDVTAAETSVGGLVDEAIWLGRLVVSLIPDEPEALGLLALMLHAEARRGARRDVTGAYVPLAEQDPTLWDAGLIEQAEALLRRASTMGVTGRYQLEAAVQSAHAVRRLGGQSDWSAIERLYDALRRVTDSPVVMINRAVAVAEVRGAETGLACLDSLGPEPRLMEYQPYWAARAELLARIGHTEGADRAYQRAIALEPDPAARAFLERQRSRLRSIAGEQIAEVRSAQAR